MISRCFWDYYLHVFQKDYAYELKNHHGVDVVWIDRPTRNPLVWFKERIKIVDGISVVRPWSLRNEYESFKAIDRKLFDLQTSKYLRNIDSVCLWSICCMHPWLSKKKVFKKKIYWPGDHFDAIEEFNQYKDYDLVMPWVGIDEIPSHYLGNKFLSSTCAGPEFMHFKNKNLLKERLDFLKDFDGSISYIGGLSWERFDFDLLHQLAIAFPRQAFLLGVKSDGQPKTQKAKHALVQKHQNIRIFEDLNYEELAELVYVSNTGIIPYRVSGQNLRICPNKFFEYSALGKPTVSTAIPSMSRYSPPAHVAFSYQQFIDLLSRKIATPTEELEAAKLKKISSDASAKKSVHRIAKSLS